MHHLTEGSPLQVASISRERFRARGEADARYARSTDAP